MKSALLSIVLCLFLGHAGFAQLYTYHVSGEAFLKNKATLVPLQPRTAVQQGQALVLRPGAQVILLDKQGRNISYAKPGVASYAVLQKAFETSSMSTGRAYLAYVWNSMHEQSSAPPKLGNTPLGGVARGDSPPQLAPVDSAVLEQPLILFEWQETAGRSPVWFTLTDAAGDPLVQLRTASPRLELQTAAIGLSRNTIYYWTVSATAESAANTPRRAFLIANTESLRQAAQELVGLPQVPEAQRWARRFRTHWFFIHAKR
ncbi:hypothetical protein LJY25_17405 [Hymenobacter sp. BT175]|uniref:hypothetical protein n=1 Tax=Hymenobacter translucens TaxID=2886507 RepID=UPI001D0ED1BB|nr:hypothetical protein [Hymenobacter translucens]MCC2548231.1 hypothetical protein [Hymenobacter translucens]